MKGKPVTGCIVHKKPVRCFIKDRKISNRIDWREEPVTDLRN